MDFGTFTYKSGGRPKSRKYMITLVLLATSLGKGARRAAQHWHLPRKIAATGAYQEVQAQ
jgi:hypothetical protein